MIFAINSSGMQFSLAILGGEGNVLSEYIITSGNKNFIALMPAVQTIFETSNIKIKDLKAIAIVVGPGSFTGLRVGLSAAKGFAQGLKLPIIGISGLEAIANQILFSENNICPLIESRKGEVFYSLFRKGKDQSMMRILEDSCARFDELPNKILSKETIFIGDNFYMQSNMIRDTFPGDVILAPPNLWSLRASTVGLLGLKRYRKKDFDDIRDLGPFYIRPPDIRKDPHQGDSLMVRQE